MSNVDDRAFSIILSLQTLRKYYLVLYVWSDSESKGGEDKFIAVLTYDYHVSQVIW